MPPRQTITRGSSEAFYDEDLHNRQMATNPQRPPKLDEYGAAVGANTRPVALGTEFSTDAYTPAPSSLKAKKVKVINSLGFVFKQNCHTHQPICSTLYHILYR